MTHTDHTHTARDPIRNALEALLLRDAIERITDNLTRMELHARAHDDNAHVVLADICASLHRHISYELAVVDLGLAAIGHPEDT